MRQLTFPIVVAAVAAAFAVAPSQGQAQNRLGGSIGGHFDLSEDWLVLSTEGRFQRAGWPVELQPRVSFRPQDGGSEFQVDANVLLPAEGSALDLFTPGVGIGLGFHRETFDVEEGEDFSESKLVANLIAGLEMEIEGSPNITPFVTTEYSFAKELANPMVLMFGVLFTISGG